MVKNLKANIKIDCSGANKKKPTTSSTSLQLSNPIISNIVHVFDNIYVGGYTEAQDLDVLKREGITHIINCSPRTCINLYEDTFTYKNIDISDEPSFDILIIFFLIVDYIDKIISMGGKVLIHCFQGISRAPSLALSYFIWRYHLNVDTSLGELRKRYSRADPNLGFLIQLDQFYQSVSASSSRIGYEGMSSSSSSSTSGGSKPGSPMMFVTPSVNEKEKAMVMIQLGQDKNLPWMCMTKKNYTNATKNIVNLTDNTKKNDKDREDYDNKRRSNK